jgi:hypothetical protein
MRFYRYGDGRWGCMACGVLLVPIRGKGNAGRKRCPGCGMTVHTRVWTPPPSLFNKKKKGCI